MLEWMSIPASISIGPLFLLLGYETNLMFGAAAGMYFLICAGPVPLLVAFAGRFRFLVWQLAALSLAISVVIDDLRVEANVGAHLKEYAGIALGFWAIASVLSAPLPIFLIFQMVRARKRQQQ
jgi:hypothetical protein